MASTRSFFLTILFCLPILSFFSKAPLFGAEVADEIWDLHEYRLIDLQKSAIIQDMDVPLETTDPQALKKASSQAIQRLDTLSQKLDYLNVSQATQALKRNMQEQIRLVREGFQDIEKKTPDRIQKEAKAYGKIRKQYVKQFRKTVKNYEVKKPQDSKVTLSQPAFRGVAKNDFTLFDSLRKQLADSQYEAVHSRLRELQNKYQETSFGDLAKLRLADCLIGSGNHGGLCWDVSQPSEGHELMSEILASGRYNPAIAETFAKWRTNEQYYFYGMSNYSVIPNWEYNLKREEIYRVIKNHVIEHPEDVWALTQIELILRLPNIERTEAIGNSNLFYWKEYYSPSNKKR